MATNFLSGYLASVTVGSTGYAFDKFSLTEENNLADVTTFVSAGAQEMIPGVFKASVKCSGPFDQGNMGAFVPGDAVTLVLGFAGAVTLSVDCLVKSCTINADCKDAQRIDVDFASTGAFTLGPP